MSSGKTRSELMSPVPYLPLASFIACTARRKVAETKDEDIEMVSCVTGRTSLTLQTSSEKKKKKKKAKIQLWILVEYVLLLPAISIILWYKGWAVSPSLMLVY